MRFGRSRTSEFNNLVTFTSPSFPLRGCRNIDLLSIAYAYRPRLRSRLTPGRSTWPGKPWVYGGPGFHRSYRYLCLHSHFPALQGQSPSPFAALGTLSYHSILMDEIQSFGRMLIAKYFRRKVSR